MPEEYGAVLLAEYAAARFQDDCGFPQENRKAIKAVFKDFVKACAELELLGKCSFAVDGTRIRAGNSKN